MVGQLGSGAWQPALPLFTGEAGAALALSWPYLQLPSYGQACRPPSMLAFPSLHTSEVLSSYPLPPGLSVLLLTVLGGCGDIWLVSSRRGTS